MDVGPTRAQANQGTLVLVLKSRLILAHHGEPSMTDPLASVRHGYDRWAAVYDHDGNPLLGLEEPIVRAAVGDVRGLDVLDLGCGTGRHAL